MRYLLNIILLSSLSLNSFAQKNDSLKHNLEIELNSIVFADFMTTGNMFLDKISQVPYYMNCNNYKAKAFVHHQILTKGQNSLTPKAEILCLYDGTIEGLNNWTTKQTVWLRIIDSTFSNFKSLYIGQDVESLKNSLKDIIVEPIENNKDSKLILTTDLFNIILWHNQKTVRLIDIQRKCI
jgi:hypothetical protein